MRRPKPAHQNANSNRRQTNLNGNRDKPHNTLRGICILSNSRKVLCAKNRVHYPLLKKRIPLLFQYSISLAISVYHIIPKISIEKLKFSAKNSARCFSLSKTTRRNAYLLSFIVKTYAFIASSIATAQATVIPTMGLLPAPIRPIIST